MSLEMRVLVSVKEKLKETTDANAPVEVEKPAGVYIVDPMQESTDLRESEPRITVYFEDEDAEVKNLRRSFDVIGYVEKERLICEALSHMGLAKIDFTNELKPKRVARLYFDQNKGNRDTEKKERRGRIVRAGNKTFIAECSKTPFDVIAQQGGTTVGSLWKATASGLEKITDKRGEYIETTGLVETSSDGGVLCVQGTSVTAVKEGVGLKTHEVLSGYDEKNFEGSPVNFLALCSKRDYTVVTDNLGNWFLARSNEFLEGKPSIIGRSPDSDCHFSDNAELGLPFSSTAEAVEMLHYQGSKYLIFGLDYGGLLTLKVKTHDGQLHASSENAPELTTDQVEVASLCGILDDVYLRGEAKLQKVEKVPKLGEDGQPEKGEDGNPIYEDKVTYEDETFETMDHGRVNEIRRVQELTLDVPKLGEDGLPKKGEDGNPIYEKRPHIAYLWRNRLTICDFEYLRKPKQWNRDTTPVKIFYFPTDTDAMDIVTYTTTT